MKWQSSFVFLGLLGMSSSLSWAAQWTPQDKAQRAHLKRTIAAAITDFEQTSRQDWKYQVSRYENEEGDITSSVERFSPHLESGKRWSLLRLNGDIPTAKQAAEYRAKHQEADGNPQANSAVFKLRDLVQLDSLVLQSESKEQLQASFQVFIERLGKDASEKLQGKLTYDAQGHFIESIEIVNTAPFSPLFGAKITDFQLVFSFQKIDTAILPKAQNLKMKGRFAFVTEIDEVSSDVYSDYVYAGSPDHQAETVSP